MADSKKKKTQKLPGDFADDLDSMLDDAASSTTGSEELMGDDDAIDQLLMDNALEAREQSDEDDDELEDLFADDSMVFDLDDEFGPEPEPVIQEVKPGEPQDVTNSAEADEFAEIDEFSDIDEFADQLVPTSGMTQSQDDDDFTVAEFDISYDDNTADEADSMISQDGDPIEAAAKPTTPTAERSMSEAMEPDRKMADAAAIDSALSAQISQLVSEQAVLKRQLAEISSTPVTDHGDEIERLVNAQQAIKKQIEKQTGNAPIIAYSALGIAIAALLMAGAFGYSGWDTSVEIEELAQRVVTLEDNQEAIIVKNNDKEVNEINAKIDQQNQTLTELAAQLTALTGGGEDENASPPLTALNTELSAAISQQKTLNDSISALDARIKQLETKTPRPLSPKTVGKTFDSHNWSVNLVSFRQEWYANRKAAEFAKKGIHPEVIAVQVKGEPWYRLTVKGFKTKSDALAYAARVKKNFNLDSVWLDKD